MRMASTGIQGLDAQFGGGFPTGSTILVVSEPSNAPYLFCEQFAAGGLIHNEDVVYYGLERPKQEVLDRLKVHAPQADTAKHLQYQDLYSVKLRDLNASTLKAIGVENHATPIHEDLPPRLLKHAKGSPFRVVIESLTQAIEAYGLEPTLKMVNTLAGVVHAMDGVALMVLIKGMHEAGVESRLRHLADGVIEFGVERQGFGLYSYISITKMRGVQDSLRLLLYKETERGLWLESTRRVF